MTPTSGRQRNYAMAMGINVASMQDRESLSNAIDSIKPTLSGAPNSQQLHFAKLWGIAVADRDTGWSLVEKLYPMIQSQAFVYSVVRRIVGAKWRFYRECDVSYDWIASAAWRLYQNPELRNSVMNMENSVSGATGDAWYKFGKRQAESAAFVFVANIVEQEIGNFVHSNQREPRLPQARTFSTEVVDAPRITTRRPKKSGCLIVLTLFGASALALLTHSLVSIIS